MVEASDALNAQLRDSGHAPEQTAKRSLDYESIYVIFHFCFGFLDSSAVCLGKFCGDLEA